MTIYAAPKPKKRRKSKPQGLRRGLVADRTVSLEDAQRIFSSFRRKKAAKGLKRSPMKPGRSVLKSKGGPPRDSERMAHVRTFGCVACLATGKKQRSHTQADHIRSRGAGGKEAGNLWALCAKHHDERHMRGLRGFEYTYKLDAKAWGRFFEHQYMLHVFRQGGIRVPTYAEILPKLFRGIAP